MHREDGDKRAARLIFSVHRITSHYSDIMACAANTGDDGCLPGQKNEKKENPGKGR